MTTFHALLAFGGAAVLLTITPGLDTALVLRSAAAAGERRAAYAAAGILLGCLGWGAAVSIGLGVLLDASRFAYAIVKWAGAAYLLWLGFNLLIHPRQRFDGQWNLIDQKPAMAFLRQGLLTNLLNPKIGIFYLTFLPQFIPAGANVAVFAFLLASIHVFLSIVWFALLILATVPMRTLLVRPRFVQAMDRVAAFVFIGFGAKLALSR